jgi:phage terminase large subunit-like protein
MGGKVIKFIETLCLLTNGRWTGERFKLQPWQKALIYELFEVRADGRRRYRRALIGLARKQGKSELAAAIALYLVLADGERSAAVYCAAASEEQADVVFEAAKRMCSMDGAPLSELVTVESKRLTSKADPYSFFERLSSKGATKHGLNPFGVVFDELHAWGVGQAEELWDAMNTGSGARDEPMQISITTAGTDLEESRCGGLYLHGRAIERGDEVDDGFFFRWIEAPPDCDFRDPANWRIAMPNFGVTVNEDFLKGELAGTNAEGGRRGGAVTESAFRRLYLNQWVDYGDSPWVTREQIQACRLPWFPLECAAPTWVGIDLSETRDSTAVAWAQWRHGERPCGHEGEPCLFLHARTWEQPRGPDGRLDEEWEVPQSEVKAHIRELASTYEAVTNVFDPWHSKLMRQDLEAEGLTCEEIHQTGARRSGASAGLYDLIIQRRLHYCDDLFERHVLNATIRETGRDGGYFLAKRRKGKVMDAAMAAVNVVYGTQFAEAGDGPSVYEQRGVLSF